MSDPAREALEQRLETLRRQAGAIQTNLVEFELELGRQVIDADALTGESRRVADELAGSTSELWRAHGLLTDLIARAERARAGRRWVELAELLTGEAIELPAVELPVSKRTLLSGSEAAPRCTASALQRSMSSQFETAKQSLARLTLAWDELAPLLDQSATAVARSRELVAELSGGARDEVERLGAEVAALSGRLTGDPLTVPRAELVALCQRVTEVRNDLAAAVELKRGLADRLARARAELAELRSALGDGEAARAELAAKIAGDPGRTAAGGGPGADLEPELDHVAALAQGGDWSTAAAALDRLTARARAALDGARRAAREYRAPIEARDQFRALLDGYRAKAAARGRIEEPELAQLYEEAHEALYMAPTDLVAAEGLVRRYQSAVNREEARR